VQEPEFPTLVVADKVNLNKDILVFKLPSGGTNGYFSSGLKATLTSRKGESFRPSLLFK